MQIFDPGIAESEEDETELLLEAVGDAVRVPGGRPLSFREGEFKAGGVSVKIFRVLFDTGALHKSYISAETVDQHREEWSQYRAVACLADQTTKVETKEIIRGTHSFVGEDGLSTMGRSRRLCGRCRGWSSSWACPTLRKILLIC